MKRRVLLALALVAIVAAWRWHARATAPAAPPPPDPAARIGDLHGLWAIAKDRAHPGPFVLRRAGGLRLEGLVVDEDEQPLGGATVTLAGGRTTTTEADGSFGFDGLAEGAYRLEAAAAPPDTAWGDERDVELTGTSDPITVKLVRGPSLVVTVVDERGAPIAGAHVESREREGTTGADGWVELRAVDARRERVTVTKAGYGQVEDRFYTGDDPAGHVEHVVTLHPGARIAGLVVDERGAPVAQASVSLSCDNGTLNADADDHGAWTIDDAIGCAWKATADHGALVSAGAVDVTTDGRTPSSGTVLHVVAGAVIDGTVVDAHGAPVAQASVRGGTTTTETDAAGHFTLVGLTPDTYELLASAGGAASPDTPVRITGREHESVRLQLAPSGITGIVVDEAGAPLPDVHVFASSDAPRWYSSDKSDEGGHFAITDVPPGDYEIEASQLDARVGEGTKLHAHTGGPPLRIVVPALGAVTGRVVIGGAPVPYFGVGIALGGQDYAYHAKHPRGMRTADARFTERNLPPGRYVITLQGTAFVTKRVEADVTPGATIDLGDITVDPGHTLRGRVIDASGAPAADVLVRLSSDPSSDLAIGVLAARAQREYAATTAADGTFAIAGLDGTDASMSVMARSGGEASAPQPVTSYDAPIVLAMHRTSR